MQPETKAAGDPIPPTCQLIEVHVGELRQLFNSIDPSPFRQRDLDPNAEEFIIGWAKEAPREATLGLLVHLDRDAGMASESGELKDAVHEFFKQRALAARRRLRQLFYIGRISLFIGFLALGILITTGEFIAGLVQGQRIGDLVRESFLIGGWVAMWRPLEIFLYEWWPIRREALLYDRLGAMPVRIVYEDGARKEAWRSDWPAVSPSDKSRRDQAVQAREMDAV